MREFEHSTLGKKKSINCKALPQATPSFSMLYAKNKRVWELTSHSEHHEHVINNECGSWNVVGTMIGNAVVPTIYLYSVEHEQPRLYP